MSADDLFFTPVQMFVTGVVILTTVIIVNSFVNFFSGMNEVPAAATTWAVSGVDVFNSMVGYAFIALFVGLMLTSFILASQLPTSIVWTPFFALLTFIAIWLSYPLSQAYVAVVESPVFVTYSSTVAIGTLIMSRLPIMILVMGCILALVTFVKFRGAQTQQI